MAMTFVSVGKNGDSVKRDRRMPIEYQIRDHAGRHWPSAKSYPRKQSEVKAWNFGCFAKDWPPIRCAIDPSSPFSGGALLGDRVRMSKYSDNDDVYIRSMGNRGDLGGLSRKAQEVGDILAASGKDVVVFETVGVGQAEHDIINTADYTAVVLVPESGDEVQLMKAGIIEIADIFIINKSDRPGSKRIERALTDILHSSKMKDSHTPKVMNTAASIGEGVEELFTKILDDIDLFKKNGKLKKRRLDRYKNRIKSIISERLENEFWIKEREDLFKNITSSINTTDTPPGSVVKQLISNFRN